MGREKIGVGRLGEKIALGFLARKGYKILKKNYRTFFGEIDAIARKDGFMVFIEIKTRSSPSLGPPYLSVTPVKQRHIIKNALFYLKRYSLMESNWRIDVVSVKLNPVRNSSNLFQVENISNGMNYEYKLESIEVIENAVEEQR